MDRRHSTYQTKNIEKRNRRLCVSWNVSLVKGNTIRFAFLSSYNSDYSCCLNRIKYKFISSIILAQICHFFHHISSKEVKSSKVSNCPIWQSNNITGAESNHLVHVVHYENVGIVLKIKNLSHSFDFLESIAIIVMAISFC